MHGRAHTHRAPGLVGVQKTPGLIIDRDHPLAAGLQLCGIFAPPHGVADITRNYPYINHPTEYVADYTRGVEFALGQNRKVEWTVGSAFSNIGGITVLSHFRIKQDATTGGVRLLTKDRSGFLAWTLNRTATTDGTPRRLSFGVHTSGSTAYAASPAAVGSDLLPHVAVGRYDGAEITCWLDGYRLATTAKTGLITSRDHAVQVAGEHTNYSPADFIAYAAMVWTRALSDDEIRSISNNPYQILRPAKRRVWVTVAQAGGAAQLAGDAAADASATGALMTGIPVAGAALSAATAPGTLTTSIPLDGLAASVVWSGGDLSASIALSGAALAQAAASAGLTTGIPLAGAAMAQSSAPGSLTIQIRLEGSALAQSAASADLTAGSSGLAGMASGSAAVGGALTTQIPLAGAALSTAVANGTLTTQIPLSGAAASVTGVVGSLDTAITLSGAAIAQALASGDLVASITFNGAALAQALASGLLSGGSYRRPARDRLAWVWMEPRAGAVIPEARRMAA